MDNRRIKEDRRSYFRLKDRADKCNRRISPDRRLNNITVEWIPFCQIQTHPVARQVFSRR
jgi:hypothetical protein